MLAQLLSIHHWVSNLPILTHFILYMMPACPLSKRPSKVAHFYITWRNTSSRGNNNLHGPWDTADMIRGIVYRHAAEFRRPNEMMLFWFRASVVGPVAQVLYLVWLSRRRGGILWTKNCRCHSVGHVRFTEAFKESRSLTTSIACYNAAVVPMTMPVMPILWYILFHRESNPWCWLNARSLRISHFPSYLCHVHYLRASTISGGVERFILDAKRPTGNVWISILLNFNSGVWLQLAFQ